MIKTIVLLMSFTLAGCYGFVKDYHFTDDAGETDQTISKDVDIGSSSVENKSSDSDNTINTDVVICTDAVDTDSDTDANTTDADVDADSDMDTGTDTDTDSDVDTDTDTDSDVDTDTDTDSDVDTNTDTDSDVDTDTDMDTDTDSDVDTDTDTDIDTNTNVDTDKDTETELPGLVACDEKNIGFCGEAAQCLGGVCRPCDHVNACGESCTACPSDHPVCFENKTAETIEYRCICNENSCDDGYYCSSSDKCEPCSTPERCGESCKECPAETPECVGEGPEAECQCTIEDGNDSCNPDGTTGLRCDETSKTCIDCNGADACGAACDSCSDRTPVCDITDGVKEAVCQECVTHEDCRGGEEPFNSPLGICTADHTCTCWVDGDPRWECVAQEYCPDGYACAEEYHSHYVCLRECDANTDDYDNGMICTQKKTDTSIVFVWDTSTTCFAYNHVIFPQDEKCERPNECGVVTDLDGNVRDGECADNRCSYSCYESDTDEDDPNRCPNNKCDVQISRLCVVE